MGYIHVTKTGAQIPVEDMDDGHLLNTITMYNRKSTPYIKEWRRRNGKPNLKEIVW